MILSPSFTAESPEELFQNTQAWFPDPQDPGLLSLASDMGMLFLQAPQIILGCNAS